MRRLVRCVACASSHRRSEASCHAAAAQRAPPLELLIVKLLHRAGQIPGQDIPLRGSFFLQCGSVVATIRADLRLWSALEPKPPRTDWVSSIRCDLRPFDDLGAVSASHTYFTKKRSITVLCPITGVCVRIQWTNQKRGHAADQEELAEAKKKKPQQTGLKVDP